MKLELLGPLRLSKDGSEIELTGPKRRALLTLLALNAGTPVSRDRIVEALWPDPQTGREESTLRVHVSHLRDEIEPERNGDPRLILTKGSAYMLSDKDVETDVASFFDLVAEGKRLATDDPEKAVDRLNEALTLWRGRPLQDVEYEEFAQDDIRRLDLARIEAIEDRAEAMVELGQDSAATEDLETLVQSDPTRERPVRLLMLALYRLGRQSDSLRVARRHTRVLAEQGLEPSPRLTGLEERILQHDPELLPEGTISSQEIKPGRSIRGYELRDEVGAGSVGVLFRAFQPSVGREVALKVVHPEMSESSEFVRRFAEEAQLVASLEHPHIVPLHDFWRDPAGAFLVMRWMAGGTLADREPGPWDANEVVRVFGQLTDALGYAHSAGVVHRDIKPDNVLFDGAGNAYLSDFGLSVTGVEATSDEGPTVASDVLGIGALLERVISEQGLSAGDARTATAIGEVVDVATNPNPADRYPDMAAFQRALSEAVGPTTAPAPRRVRRNPYKGLNAFEENDRAFFYGRDEIIETLVGKVGAGGLTTVIGASGSGKSSVVMAGLVPELRDGALPGSDEWSPVYMVPGSGPFDEFHIALRSVAVTDVRGRAGEGSNELRAALIASLEGQRRRALLVVDQFEELFAAGIDDDTRDRFLDNLIDLATDSAGRYRVVLTLRADFSDRPLTHARFGELMSRGSVLIAPMRPEQIEDAVRKPAARVGVQVEPGLVAEIIRDVASAPAFLPLLQYVLSELFERRTEDRLTIDSYRSLGGVQGVLERRAEATFASLEPEAQRACQQLFLRMVHLGDHGETTRRRLPLTELPGLGPRGDIEKALEAFSAARILTYDRDPVSRAPTVEVAHETVIDNWARYQVWIDDTRADVLAHRRLAAATATWVESGEDPSFLLTGGPLAAATSLASNGRVGLNEAEARFVAESGRAHDERRHQEQAVEHRSRRRLRVGIGVGIVALLVGVLAVFAVLQRQRAEALAAQQERQSTARQLASSSLANLDSADPDLSLLLAIEAAELSIDAGEEILPEVVEALHRAVVNPRPSLIIEGAASSPGGQVISYSRGGTHLAMVDSAGGLMVVDPDTGETVRAFAALEEEAFGVDFHFGGSRLLSIHADGVREWDWKTGSLLWEFSPETEVATAGYSPDGRLVGVGGNDGKVTILLSSSAAVVTKIQGHEGRVGALAFDRAGTRIATGGGDAASRVWDVDSGALISEASTETILLSIEHLAWHPLADVVVVTNKQAETFLFDANTGERLNSFGNGQNFNSSVAFESSGSLLVAAGGDGVARVYGTFVGGEAAVELPTGGVPLRDAEFEPGGLTVATVGVDGKVRIWPEILGSELPIRITQSLYPRLMATEGGDRYVIAASQLWLGTPSFVPAAVSVVESASDEAVLSWPTVRGEVGLGRTAIDADGTKIALPGADGGIEILDVTSGSSISLPDSGGFRATLDFNADGTRLAAGSFDGEIRIWDSDTAELIQVLQGHGDREPANRSVPISPNEDVSVRLTTKRVNEVAWLPGDGRLASTGYDGTVRIWDVSTGQGRVIHEAAHESYALAATPDGQRIVTIDLAGTIVEIEVGTGVVGREFESMSSAAALTMSPDGKYLAGAGLGGAVLWDMESGQVVRRFEDSVYAPTDVIFVNAGTQLRVSSGEGAVRGYHVDPIDILELARGQVSRSLTSEECSRYLGTDGC